MSVNSHDYRSYLASLNIDASLACYTSYHRAESNRMNLPNLSRLNMETWLYQLKCRRRLRLSLTFSSQTLQCATSFCFLQ
jgi:hypothetical protein